MEFVSGKSIKDIIRRVQAKNIPIPPAHIADIVASVVCRARLRASTDPTVRQHAQHHSPRRQPTKCSCPTAARPRSSISAIAKSEMTKPQDRDRNDQGKFVYMSPEQSRQRKSPDQPPAPIFFPSGIVFTKCWSGDNPFQKANIVLSSTRFSAFNRRRHRRSIRISLPLMRHRGALAKKANDRYSDCSEMKMDLRRAILLGENRQAAQNLQQFMQQLFREQIEKKQKFIQETGKGQALLQGRRDPGAKHPRDVATSSYNPNQYGDPTITPQPTPLPIHQPDRASGSAMVRRRKRRWHYPLWSVILVRRACRWADSH